jgi:beta-mannosidase
MTNPRLDLKGTWQLREDCPGSQPLPAALPGDTHSALLAAGRIPDPYWGRNELDLQSLNRRDWVFSRSFEVGEDLLAAEHVYLHFDALDTIAAVYLNGQLAGQSRNMFVRQRFPVREFLRPGQNEIAIHLRSAENEARGLAASLPYEVPCSEYPVQSPHRNLVRKVQCHAGWDWGCCLMVAGAYGELYLAAADPGRIEYVYTVQEHAPGQCRLKVCCEVWAPLWGQTELEVRIAGQHTCRPVKLEPGVNLIEEVVEIPSPQLWWPNGYGDQPLYELEVKAAGDILRKRLGLRRLELVAQEDETGLGFKFRVNGLDLFAKGANWIPCDALPARQTREVLDDLLSSAAQAHMNMLRVWGGGQYESEDFYELCDEKGLLVWQDFMFSCSAYPATPDFLASVEEEARHQVKRLRDHACLALWCGNNEDLGALNWYEVSRKHRDRYLVDYDRLNEGVLGRVVDACDPTRTFWPSSPCAGRGDYSDNWRDDRRGDMHYWRVWHEGRSFDAYYAVTPRFCSEFGYQSFPSLACIRTYAPPEQFNVTAPVMEHHQRHPGGNARITEMFARYFRLPEGFANFAYLSQVQQGLAIKTAVEHWRHLRPVCMGALYWQLNDLWPVCSWSSLEYGGKWKLLHYMARRFYAPIIASAFQNGDELELWLTNDRSAEVPSRLTLRVLDFAGGEKTRRAFAATVPAGSALKLGAFPVAELAPKPDEVFAVLDLEAGEGLFRNTHFFAPYKACDLRPAQVRTAVAGRGGQFTVALTADTPVFFLSLDLEGWRGEFDDNCITLLPGEERQLRFTPKGPAPALEQFEQALVVRHLRVTYP